MKKFTLFLVMCILFSCDTKQVKIHNELTTIKETIRIEDSIKQSITALDSSKHIVKVDSLIILKKVVDTLKTQLFLSNYKISKVQFYLNICLKDKTGSQDKFLKGWIRRAIE